MSVVAQEIVGPYIMYSLQLTDAHKVGPRWKSVPKRVQISTLDASFRVVRYIQRKNEVYIFRSNTSSADKMTNR